MDYQIHTYKYEYFEKLLKNDWDRTCTIPIHNKNIRSLNLANSVSIVLFEAIRQINENF